jgi:fumarate hydratase, class I
MRGRIVELIRECATDLPSDAESALRRARKKEKGIAQDVLDTILENVELARKKSRPMCQDTGTPIFYVTAPAKVDREKIKKEIAAAVRKATRKVPLRANAVDPVTGMNSCDNVGVGVPVVHFTEWRRKKIRIELMIKGGGSENVTQLYRLPSSELSAGRDLNGVMRCVLDAVHKAQGKGCPPYVIGVGVGGLADSAIRLSKKQLLREIGDVNLDPTLKRLEKGLRDKINSLGIGPMGLGGRTTALAVKVGKQHRHPASYFVAVSFSCWACRRHAIEVKH